jgi:hypothetical protein
MLRQSAATHDEVCAGVAPTACAAAMMSAMVLPKPTRAATIAEVMIDSRIGRSSVQAWPFRRKNRLDPGGKCAFSLPTGVADS